MRTPTAERSHPHEILFHLDAGPVTSKPIQRIYRFPNGWGLSVSGLTDRNAWDLAVMRYWGEEPWDCDIAWQSSIMKGLMKRARSFPEKQVEGVLTRVEALPKPEPTKKLGRKRGRPLGSQDLKPRQLPVRGLVRSI